ncbi:MAG: hypothetical protein K2X57_33100 [Xanthobacteraceae bacterium]|nr:hypothetical protein [Xanthobacteraceae bacterium]
MTTYRDAFDVLREAINDPDNPEKLRTAKKHPRLKTVLNGFTTSDLQTLQKVLKAAPGAKAFKCDDS